MTFHRFCSQYAYWPLVQKLKGEYVARALSELTQSQWGSPEELIATQWKLVNRTVTKAAQEVPYYREMYKKARWDFQKERFTYEEFLKLPTIEKEDVRDRLPEFLNPTYHERMTTGTTSGSTGQSLTLYYTAEHQSYSEAARWRGKSWWGIGPGDAQITLWGRTYYSKKDRFLLQAKHYCMNNLYFSAIDFREETLKGIWKQIRNFRPEIIYGYAASIYSLAAYLKNHQIPLENLELKVIMLTAESITDVQKAVIEEVFGCPTANEYGCSETGGFVYECCEKNWHISTELTFIEFLDHKGSPVASSETGEIFLTHLRNDAMPLIRYRVGDVGKPLSGTCSCGRGLPLMGVSVTKGTDVIRLHNGETFSSEALNSINKAVMEQYPSGILQFRVRQKTLNGFEAEIVPGPQGVAAAESRFLQLMQDTLGCHINVTMKRVPYIEREPTGKLRYFISDLPSI